MIGALPTSLNVNGKDYAIRTDYRVVLTIFEAYNEPDYDDDVKAQIVLECLFDHPDELSESDLVEALNKATWFINCGEETENSKIPSKKVMDWEQDEQLVFSAVNKVACKEVRALEYMHWWTFLSYFKDRGECFLNTIINLRDKLNKKEKLTKDEREFYKNNKSMIDLKKRLTAKEKEEEEYLNSLLG